MKDTVIHISADQLRALHYWIMQLLGLSTSNHYERLHLLVLTRLLVKKIAPKLAVTFGESTYKIKLPQEQAEALQLSFLRYDYFSTPGQYPSLLGQLSLSLPQIVVRQPDNLLPPVVIDEWQEEE